MAGKKKGGQKGPRNWIETQKRFISRVSSKAISLSKRLDADPKLKAALDSFRSQALAVGALFASLPSDFRPTAKRFGMKVGDDVFMRPDFRVKYEGLVNPKSATEPMKVEKVQGRRVMLKLSGGESLILPMIAVTTK
jgi:hypothetical protein